MNPVVHFEIPVEDLKRAKTFYQNLFGWQMFDFDEESVMTSTTETDEKGTPLNPGAINGSIYFTDKPRTTNIVIDVDDIHSHIKKIEQIGGKLVDDVVPVADMGMYARFSDPDGNLIGLWQSVGDRQVV